MISVCGYLQEQRSWHRIPAVLGHGSCGCLADIRFLAFSVITLLYATTGLVTSSEMSDAVFL